MWFYCRMSYRKSYRFVNTTLELCVEYTLWYLVGPQTEDFGVHCTFKFSANRWTEDFGVWCTFDFSAWLGGLEQRILVFTTHLNVPLLYQQKIFLFNAHLIFLLDRWLGGGSDFEILLAKSLSSEASTTSGVSDTTSMRIDFAVSVFPDSDRVPLSFLPPSSGLAHRKYCICDVHHHQRMSATSTSTVVYTVLVDPYNGRSNLL